MSTAFAIAWLVLALGAVGELTSIRKALEATREIHETHLGLYAQAYASLREPDGVTDERGQDVPLSDGTHGGGYL